MRAINQLRERRAELERIAAGCATECDHIYHAISEITLQIIERNVRRIPNVDKFLVNYSKGTVEIFFGVYSKILDLKEVSR